MLTRSQQLLGAALATLLGSGCGDDRARPRGDAALVDAAVPDVAVPDVTVPDVTVPDVTVPDVAVPDVAVPDATLVDARSSDAAAPATVLWTVRGPGSPTTNSLVRAIAWDASGALWLAGTDRGDVGFIESTAWVRRLDLRGAPLWRHTVDVADAEDDFRGIAADGSGEAFAVGRSNRGLLTERLDASGNVLWSGPAPDPRLDPYFAEDVVVAFPGSWELVGGSFGLGFVFIARYSSTGGRQETGGLSTRFCDSSAAQRIARSRNGDFLIGGYTCSEEFGAPTFLRRTAPNLLTRFELFDPGLPSVQGVAFVDDDLVVCSHRALHRYSSTGLLQWRQPLVGLCQRIAVTPDDHIIVAESYPGGSARISSLTGSGSPRWQTSYRGAANLGASPADLDVASDGTIYVAGSEMTVGKSIYYVQALAP